jgi:phosphoglycerate dehydrogenase-like enzyme
MKAIGPQEKRLRSGQWGDFKIRTLDWKTATVSLSVCLSVCLSVSPSHTVAHRRMIRNFPLMRDTQIGIVGLGNLGSNLARMCSALGFRVVYNTRSPRSDVPYEHVPLEDLWARSDAIVLACPLTSSTRGLVCKDTIARMRDGVILVNVCGWTVLSPRRRCLRWVRRR